MAKVVNGRSFGGPQQGRTTVVKMFGFNLEINTSAGVAGLEQRIAEIRGNIDNLQPALARWGDYIVNEHIPAQFDAQGTPKRWASLKEPYATRKREIWGNKPILVRTGRMRDGFRHETGRKSMRVVNRVTAGQSNRIPRWIFHQDGTPRMVARPMIQLTDDDRDELSLLVLTYVTGDVDIKK